MKIYDKKLAYPYFVWMTLFTVVPLLIVVYYAFTDGNGAFTHFLCNLLCQRFVHIGNDDGCAFFIQFLRNALAEALGRAGHDADLAAEPALASRTLAHIGLCNLAPFGHINRHKSTLFLEVYLSYTCICMLIQDRLILFFWFVARFA